MTDLRTAAKAALWAFQYHVEQTWPTDRSTAAIAALRAALAQEQAEATVKESLQVAPAQEQAEPKGGGNLPPPLQAEPVQEPDLSRCPQCGGIADNGHDRSIPPNPYLCMKCMAEPAQEPDHAYKLIGCVQHDCEECQRRTQREPLTKERLLYIYNQIAEHQQTLALQQRSYEREIEIEVEAEREACAKLAESTICDTHLPTGVRIYGTRVADAIRARGIA